MSDRPDWDNYYLNLAAAVALRANCTRRKVGAVLVRAANGGVAATGYNGAPSGAEGCLEGACPRGLLTVAELPPDSDYSGEGEVNGSGRCDALHAEWNVLLRASWADLQGATLYITDEPCHICKVLIAGSGITKVMWGAPNSEIETELETEEE